MYGTVRLALFFLFLVVDTVVAQFESTVAAFSTTDFVFVVALDDSTVDHLTCLIDEFFPSQNIWNFETLKQL